MNLADVIDEEIGRTKRQVDDTRKRLDEARIKFIEAEHQYNVELAELDKLRSIKKILG